MSTFHSAVGAEICRDYTRAAPGPPEAAHCVGTARHTPGATSRRRKRRKRSRRRVPAIHPLARRAPAARARVSQAARPLGAAAHGPGRPRPAAPPLKAGGAASPRRRGPGEDGGGRGLGRAGPGAVVVRGSRRAGGEAAGGAGQEEGYSRLQRCGHGSAAGAVGGAGRCRGGAALPGARRGNPGVGRGGAALPARGSPGGCSARRLGGGNVGVWPPRPRRPARAWRGGRERSPGLAALGRLVPGSCGLRLQNRGERAQKGRPGELPCGPRLPAAPFPPPEPQTRCGCTPVARFDLNACWFGVLRDLCFAAEGWIAGEILISH